MMLVKTVEKFHYSPAEMDAEWGSLVAKDLVENLDPEGLIFTREEVEGLLQETSHLELEIKMGRCKFLEKITALYEQKLIVRDSVVRQLLDKSWTFPEDEMIDFPVSVVFFEQEKMEENYKKQVTFRTALEYISRNDSLWKEPSEEELEQIRKDILGKDACKLSQQLNHPDGIEGYVGEKYLETIASTFDPHTNYFSSRTRKRFESHLSEEAMSYGFRLGQNIRGEIEIMEITPGSPAWNSNVLNEGDVLLSVEVAGQGKKEFTCQETSEALRMMSESFVNEARFTVRKQDGSSSEVVLHKGKVQVDDNIIQSFILDGPRKIGYIYLPSFYAQVSDQGTSYKGCADELATSLIKLKREGIEGLVFDVRGNGGGSMYEAIRVAGMFINFGAVAMAAMRDEEGEIMKDQSRGMIFDRPMVVLQDQMSASASELFSAAIQDYHRGVIVGGTSFGKATIQQIIPVDAYRFGEKPAYRESGEGFVKLTTGKFFRVTGDSHQQTGVIPDIPLPQKKPRYDYRENTLPNSLDNTSLDKDSYYRPLKELPLMALRDMSRERTETDRGFIQINVSNLSKDQAWENPAPLSVSKLKAFLDEIATTKIEQEEREPLLGVNNPEFLNGISSQNPLEEKVNQHLIEKIEEDIHIRESFSVLIDLITLTKNN